MPGQHTEHASETAIEHHLTTADGYEKIDWIGSTFEALIFATVVGKFDVRENQFPKVDAK